MKIPRSWIPALVVALLAFLTGGWLLQEGVAAQESTHLKARLFEEVHQLVSDRFVEPVPPGELYQMAIDGMLYELGDPYSVFLTPDEYRDLALTTTGNYGGLGIRIDSNQGWITVMGVLPGTPAEREGLQTGDRITAVEGESAEDWTLDEAVTVLRGPEGAPVTISVARVGVEVPLDFTIVRADIHVEALNAFMLNERIGYAQLLGFSKESADELARSIDSLRNVGAEALVLDLRNNTGGLLDEGVAISDLFLPAGAEVVATRSRLEDQNFTFRAADDASYTGLPVVVLVNGYSASASEILAGALQDHDRALVIGTTTYGKGSVQTLYELPASNYLKLTTAHWYTPSGRSIQKERERSGQLGELADAAIEEVDGRVDVETDTAGREVFRTDGGRAVYGGGGVTPDLIVLPDTLTEREKEFATKLAKKDVSLIGAAFDFAVRWAAENPAPPRGFDVSASMLEDFYDLLGERAGEPVDRELYGDARRLVREQLGIQIARVAFGDLAMRKRMVDDSRQVRIATELLAEAETSEDLFALAEEREADLARISASEGASSAHSRSEATQRQ